MNIMAQPINFNKYDGEKNSDKGHKERYSDYSLDKVCEWEDFKPETIINEVLDFSCKEFNDFKYHCWMKFNHSNKIITTEFDIQTYFQAYVSDNMNTIFNAFCIEDRFRRISSGKSIPDIIFSDSNGNRIYNIEIKNPWMGAETFHYDLVSLYNEQIHETDHITKGYFKSAIKQVFCSMLDKEVKYSVLSTLSHHWFFKYQKEEEKNILYISKCFSNSDSESPSLYQCLFYLRILSERTSTSDS